MIRYQPTPPAPSAPAQVSCRAALVGRMADDIRELAFAGQNANAEALAARGWSAGSIKRLGPDAVVSARRQSVRQVA